MELREQLLRTLGSASTLERELGGGDPNRMPNGRDPIHLPVWHRQPGDFHEVKGDRGKAAEHYRKVIDLWKNADLELQPVVTELRARMRRLSDNEPPRNR